MRHIISFSIIAVWLFSVTGCAGIAANSSVDPARIIDLGNGICQDTKSGLMWAKERTRTIRSMDDAQRAATELELAGYDDWRLPTIYELYDIHYAYDLKLGEACAIELEGNYWSDEKDGEGMVGAWEIGAGCGPEREYFGKNTGYVRAVRP